MQFKFYRTMLLNIKMPTLPVTKYEAFLENKMFEKYPDFRVLSKH